MRFRSRSYLSLSNPAGSSEHETPRYDPSLDLPGDASFSGWSDGERELWMPVGFEMLRRQGASFIYLSYDDHTERWPEMRFGCM